MIRHKRMTMDQFVSKLKEIKMSKSEFESEVGIDLRKVYDREYDELPSWVTAIVFYRDMYLHECNQNDELIKMCNEIAEENES